MTTDEAALWVARARWRRRSDVTPGRLETWLAAARAALAAGAEPCKRERHKAMYALALAGIAPDFLLKIERHTHASRARRLLAAPAESQLRVAERLAAHGIATPVPAAAGAYRQAGFLEVSLLLVPIVPDSLDFAEFWHDDSRLRSERRAATRALGVLARKMHETGVDQDDFAPNNFLWRASRPPNVLAIDFERVRLRRSLPHSVRARQLAKLDRHAIGAHASDRLRLLRAYTGGDRQAARAWWHAVAIEHCALADRDFRHLLRTGTRGSRRFVQVSEHGWRGWARRDICLASVLRAAATTTPAKARHRLRPLGDLTARAAAHAWAAALTLAQRGCGPEPVALLHREGLALLVSETVANSRPLADADLAVARGALVGLLSRLLVFGFEPDALGAEDIELVPGRRGGWRAVALDPRGFRAARSAQGSPAHARAWATALLATLDSAAAAT